LIVIFLVSRKAEIDIFDVLLEKEIERHIIEKFLKRSLSIK